MKKIISTLIIGLLSLIVGLTSVSAASSVKVKGYTKKDGTYVQSYYKTKGNSSKSDNYSSKGNSNPYTGKKGTISY